MKIKVVSFLLISLSASLYADYTLLQCPKTLSLKNKEELKRFGLSVKKDILEDSNEISHIFVQGNMFLNKEPVPFKQELNFYDEYDANDIERFLDKTVLLPKLSGIRDGVLECVYQVKDELQDKKQLFALTTRSTGEMYQCPHPKELKIVDTQKTSFVKVVSLPRCNDGNKELCEQSKIEMYVFFKDFIIPENQKKSSHFNITYNPDQEFIGKKGLLRISLDGKVTAFKGQKSLEDEPEVLTHHEDRMIRGNKEKQVFIDPTDTEKRPMLFEWQGDKDSFYQTYTYQFKGEIGELELFSAPVGETLIPVRGAKVVPPALVNGINRGFNKYKALNEYGKLLIPHCSATHIKEGKDLTALQCTYGNNKDPRMNLVLEADLTKKVREEHCKVYHGEYKGKEITTLVNKKSKFVVPSLMIKHDFDNDGDQEEQMVSPVILLCDEK